MLSQLFVMSLRGDTIVRRDFNSDVPSTSIETFFRCVPCCVVDPARCELVAILTKTASFKLFPQPREGACTSGPRRPSRALVRGRVVRARQEGQPVLRRHDAWQPFALLGS